MDQDGKELMPSPNDSPDNRPDGDWRDFPARYRQQILGFIGWFVVASVLAPISFGLITFPGTLIILLLLAKSKGFAGGVLIAVALNFVAALIRGVSLNAFCFIPFYYY